MRLTVRLTPRGGGDRIEGWDVDAAGRSLLKVRVSSPPADGQANAALERLIAKTLKLPVSAVRVVTGHTARIKQLELEGADAERIAAELGASTP